MKYAILSDIHGNLEAFTTVLNKCRELNVDSYVCLGDVVGYNADPKACLDMVRGLKDIIVVKGNHDEYASNNDEKMEGFNPHARAAVLWTKDQLTTDDRAWLAELPMRLTIKGSNMTIVHATLDSPDTWGYIFDAHHAADNFSYQFTQLCFCGHSHVPIAFAKKPLSMRTDRAIEEVPWAVQASSNGMEVNPEEADFITLKVESGVKYLINIGSIGQPRNRDPRASFAVYDTEARELYRYRLPYAIPQTQAKILAAGLPDRLASRLALGI